MVRAVALLVAAAAAAVVVSFVLDRFLDLPLAVRAVHLALLACGFVALAAWVVAPLRTRLSDTDLAQALEDVVPDLKDRVSSALDFERRLDDPEERESREMMRAVIRQASAYVQRVRPGALVDARPARHAATFAFCAALAVVTLATLAPSDFALWFQRGILLEDIEWPRRTHIRVLEFEPGVAKVVTRGDDLQIVAEIEGVRPDELRLHYEALEYRDGDATPTVTEVDTRRMFALEDESGATGKYTFDFRAVSTSFRFWVTGGDDDDRDPVHVVRAMVPPRVASITARVTYPEHSGIPDAIVREANFQVLTGSRVQLALTTNMPLAAARLVPDDGPVRELTVTNSAAGGGGTDDDGGGGGERDQLNVEFTIHEDVQFHLELTAAEGQTNRVAQDRFFIRALPDQPPVVRMLFPIGRMYRTPNGLIPVKALVKDDFGLATARLELFTDESALLSRPLFPRPGETATNTDSGAGKQPVHIYAPVKIGELGGENTPGVVPGDVLRLTLYATDNTGQESSAPEVTLEILAPEDLERRLAQKQVGLRDQLTQLRTHQRRTLDGIRKLRTQVSDKPIDRGFRNRGRDLQVEQGRVTGEIDRFLRGIHRSFDAYVLNRLGSEPTVDRVLPMYHAALSIPTDGSTEVFPRSLYAEIVTAKRERRLYDPNILGALLDIMDLGDVALTDLSPGVYEALRAWSGDDEARTELLDEAERRAVELETQLRELDRRMDRWEDLNELIELARQITNRQRELSDDAKKTGAEKPGIEGQPPKSR